MAPHGQTLPGWAPLEKGGVHGSDFSSNLDSQRGDLLTVLWSTWKLLPCICKGTEDLRAVTTSHQPTFSKLSSAGWQTYFSSSDICH